MLVVGNAGPISAFLLVDRVELLFSIFPQVHIPGKVREELRQADFMADVLRMEREGKILTVNLADEEKAAAQGIVCEIETANPERHLGEAEAMMLCEKLHADLLLLDEEPARRVASSRGLRIVGSLGILLENVRRGNVTARELKEIIDLMMCQGVRISESLKDDVINKAYMMEKER